MTETPGRPTASQSTPQGLRILALGDSYTIGEGVAEGERWPILLAERLRSHSFEVAPPRIIAQTGWTTDELALAVEQARLDGFFDLVTLLVGVNNQYRGRSTAEYRVEFRGLVEQAIGFAEGHQERVIVLSIPDWGVTPYAEGRDRLRIAREIDEFNCINRAEADTLGAVYVDVTQVSRLAASQPCLLALDGLHPSAQMYALWADLALRAALTALGLIS